MLKRLKDKCGGRPWQSPVLMKWACLELPNLQQCHITTHLTPGSSRYQVRQHEQTALGMQKSEVTRSVCQLQAALQREHVWLRVRAGTLCSGSPLEDCYAAVTVQDSELLHELARLSSASYAGS